MIEPVIGYSENICRSVSNHHDNHCALRNRVLIRQIAPSNDDLPRQSSVRSSPPPF
jgi:hypothetical protein